MSAPIEAAAAAPTWADRIAAARAVPENLGDGWMSRNARDMIVIAAFAGFDRGEVVRRVAMRSDPNRTTNAATVEAVLAEMWSELAAEGEQQ